MLYQTLHKTNMTGYALVCSELLGYVATNGALIIGLASNRDLAYFVMRDMIS